MDRCAREIVNERVGKGISALVLLALLLVQAGCHWGARGGTPPPTGPEELAGDNTAPAAVTEWLPPVVASGGAEEAADASPAGDNAAIGASPPVDNAAIGAPEAVAPAAIGRIWPTTRLSTEDGGGTKVTSSVTLASRPP